ncbi:putative baseplate assembly protein [Dulcicalothrix desertica PCC 7102]|uniref:Putative baseplate assembly protein n=1 Tax=Dulcicalothrix desertica PCC 7102 TaxID=232991 RepID=A0A3S1AIB1_9CYAN|nr:putative baseplate assembly protein [Dulcicalothrix desertica]RUT01478.1 putative baseplate assembly protein [Dulcicalothrix desertica PCC 7102]TWH43485.1 putative phage baseplate assembly protein [Dulcicalothrix desertica PCC 7102]
MSFDFLPRLPNSHLDDRTFDDLVEECLLRIPRYCPEWTDHNLSDPGITLIELFAWLTDQMLMQFNQIPRKNYIAFLELLGIRLQPPTPAQVRLSFYLSTHLLENYTIPRGTEVATERTETQEAIVFTTDQDLLIGQPTLKHIFSAPDAANVPKSLQDRTEQWHPQNDGLAVTHEFELFPQKPQSGNSFYLTIEPDTPLEGTILEIAFTGAQGTPTGIDPKHPPRSWEAWDGESWVKVLLQEADDTTNGFSFNENAGDDDSFEQSGDVILHLPERWPVSSFDGYRGRWIRCILTEFSSHQPGYTNSPRIKTIAIRAIGGSVQASQCVLIQEEILGISDGQPGQSFEVETAPILENRDSEQLLVLPFGRPAEIWQKVEDFADSKPQDRHYVVDALAGTIQFGPSIREPQTLKKQTQTRAYLQQVLPADRLPGHDLHEQIIEQQYGAIPPYGAEIIFSYRTGGGKQGNVQANTLKFMQTAIPYIDRVTNHHAAVNGADAESLERAVLRAPQMLRSHDRAVTASDFEALTLKGSGGAIARALTLPTSANQPAGSVSVCVVPQANTELIALGRGIAPDNFNLNSALRDQVLRYLDERRLLGVQVQLQQPNYFGVSVQAEVTLEPAYNNPSAQAEIVHKIKVTLYRYLNPLTGGQEMTGWPFGRPLYPSDIMALLQQIPGIQYLGAILLFPIQQNGESWQRQTTPVSYIDPGALGLLCSWADPQARTGHSVNVLKDQSAVRI